MSTSDWLIFVFVSVDEYISDDSLIVESVIVESATIDVWIVEFCCMVEFDTFAFCRSESFIVDS